ncbi:hypothetical protein BAGA_13300 [Bacillus gaemokensis]|uniref:Uncharacterized protein n=1 Tax=Bacillus gaemokensis TaxID=574375 RepID=A0A073KGE8_9BACI|nr:hypothetical protein BAGA_13300 [Bacillus gaemokensis]KYG36977.1 hypothetical protein AZF08_06090 [Bacillus gaemokensis]
MLLTEKGDSSSFFIFFVSRGTKKIKRFGDNSGFCLSRMIIVIYIIRNDRTKLDFVAKKNKAIVG